MGQSPAKNKEALDMMKRGKGGFTLVELLIVIMIIGILAGLVMLGIGEARDSAEATRIINDLRSVKAACLMYYAEEGNWPSQTNTMPQTYDLMDALEKYLGRPLDRNRYSAIRYYVERVEVTGKHTVGLNSAENGPLDKASVRKKLLARVADAGLVNPAGEAWDGTDKTGAGEYGIFIFVN